MNNLKTKFSSKIKIVEGSKSKINNGLQIVGKEQILFEFGFTEKEYKKLNREQRQEYSQRFKDKYTSNIPAKQFSVPLIEAKDLIKFKYKKPRIFLGDISNFQRTRKPNIYSLPKILFNRTGQGLNAVVSNSMLYYNFDVYSIFLKNNDDIYFYSALINSSLLNYFVDFNFRKRVNSSFPKIGHEAILNLPLIEEPNSNIVDQISKLVQEITKRDSENLEKELNELIYELYELSYWEKQRIEDYFLADKEKRIGQKRTALEKYKSTLKGLLNFYFKNPIKIEETPTEFGLKVIKILLNQKSDTPTAQKTVKFLLNEIFEHNPNENFFASQEKIYGKDCVYIIKEDINKNWTETKAFEDVQDLLKHLIPNEDGERIH